MISYTLYLVSLVTSFLNITCLVLTYFSQLRLQTSYSLCYMVFLGRL